MFRQKVCTDCPRRPRRPMRTIQLKVKIKECPQKHFHISKILVRVHFHRKKRKKLRAHKKILVFFWKCLFAIIIAKIENQKCNFPMTPEVRLSVGWLVYWSVNWFVGLSVGWMVCQCVGWSVSWLVGLSVGQLVCQLVGWSVSWLDGL